MGSPRLPCIPGSPRMAAASSLEMLPCSNRAPVVVSIRGRRALAHLLAARAGAHGQHRDQDADRASDADDDGQGRCRALRDSRQIHPQDGENWRMKFMGMLAPPAPRDVHTGGNGSRNPGADRGRQRRTPGRQPPRSGIDSPGTTFEASGNTTSASSKPQAAAAMNTARASARMNRNTVRSVNPSVFRTASSGCVHGSIESSSWRWRTTAPPAPR